jgi:hypothetical protein
MIHHYVETHLDHVEPDQVVQTPASPSPYSQFDCLQYAPKRLIESVLDFEEVVIDDNVAEYTAH